MGYVTILLFLTQLFYVYGADYVYYDEVDIYYKFHRKGMNWGEAFFHCRSENAALAMPQNEKEFNVLLNIIKKYPFTALKDYYVYIGLHDLYTEGEYLYVNDKPIEYGYNIWKPSDTQTSDCHAMLFNSTYLIEFSCDNVRGFICEKRNFRSHVTMPMLYTNKGYVYWPNVSKSYKLHTDKRTWGLARTMCDSEGGHLAIIRNIKEENILKQMFNDPKYNLTNIPQLQYAFVGFHDIFKEGHFITVRGEDFEDFKYWNWDYKSFKSDDKHNCGAFDRNTGCVVAYNCSTATVFFCEKSEEYDYVW